VFICDDNPDDASEYAIQISVSLHLFRYHDTCNLRFTGVKSDLSRSTIISHLAINPLP
jgi:hypothetical protein